MALSILDVSRTIIHDVVRNNKAEPELIPAVMSTEIFSFGDQDTQNLIIDRLTTTLGQGSKCVDVEVADGTPETFQKIAMLLDATDDQFITNTQSLAQYLSRMQISGAIKSGTAIFLQGKCNYDGNVDRYIAIIKADPDKALGKHVVNGSIKMELIKELFLSNAQRMIKVAFLVETSHPENMTDIASRDPEDFVIKVYDHLMSNSGDQSAARYFYQSFLGCKIAANSATISRKFLDVSEKFIMESTNITQEDKEKYRGNLIAYMRGEVNNIVPQEVANTIFPAQLRDSYIHECENNNVASAFIKDTSLIKRKLAKRTIKFDSNVVLYIPASVPQDNINVSNRDEEGWTTIKILGRITS